MARQSIVLRGVRGAVLSSISSWSTFIPAALLVAGCANLQESTDVAPTSSSDHAATDKKEMSPIVGRKVKQARKASSYADMSANDIAVLAEKYYNGYGVAKDIAKGLDLFRLAAEKGSGYACRRLGLEYSDFAFDDQTPRDDKMARSWFEKGAELQDAESMYYLSEFVYNGRGGPKDEKRGTELLLAAARLKSQGAAHRAVKLNRKGTLALSPEDKLSFYVLDKQLRDNVTAMN